ncbi:MAG: CDP-glycerol glycerophosphotransferase family protein [Anaerolineales bacterium]|uniref:CDP-glycerol glycerophosphotransferase family protein n=1 Tax=Candidatus Desulfolinea nitratireducens TaxID=2841698 RepID=A0A8J6NJU8_9CHLR|nr:CDP-glycerol glycerophosphotransferase family protein [Candidatus Desulfolinea nitratireducens]MBL6959535.1 CDP-glycerol glycerophosphotransferase family protein [Anaerolineales bacterium]
MTKRIFIIADHGMALIYFLQSDVVQTLLDVGVEVVLFTDDETKDRIAERFGQPNLIFEGLRLKEANAYAKSVQPRLQALLIYLRRVGGSWRINNQAEDSHIWEVLKENTWKFRIGIWLPSALMIILLRSSKWARKMLVRMQMRFTPGIYRDLFEKYQPDLVIASTAGWRVDRYLLGEAKKNGIPTMAAIIGWDNPSSYAIPGAFMDWATCWSEKQKEELVLGSDWEASHVHIGGIPSYDGYFRKTWLMSREEYFKLHNLNPSRKLISYACSFVHFAPNFPNVEALAKIVNLGQLDEPSQLLIRLHPSHFQDKPEIFAEERAQIHALEEKHANVHVVRPVALGGSLGYYGGEDMDEKTSMMAYSDVFVTVYSTMVVEAAVHNRPIVAAVIDTLGGWNKPGKYSLALQKIGGWPTHLRFREANAGRVAATESELRDVVNAYLNDPTLDGAERKAFIEQEITFTDATSGKRTAEFVLKVLSK